METNVYISNLFDQCVDKMSNPTESFPILNRNNKYGAITERESYDTPGNVADAVCMEWDRLQARYGDFNDIQNEQRMLVEHGFNILSNYQEAIATRSNLKMTELSDALPLLKEALDELVANEYIIREMFYAEGVPQCIAATST